MAEYIDREAFVKAMRKQYCEKCDRRRGKKNGKVQFIYNIGEAPCRACGVDDMLFDIEDIPAADVVPVVHGKWEILFTQDISDCIVDHCRCTKCGLVHIFVEKHYGQYNWCPQCGARMDGGT